ncbi:MAG: hypothetical protein QG585_54 [Patescibacteria group bacterium]|jgi:hypothetical protein|nr:hypothetical protein [Patescibacteria group bacterium]
MDYKTILTVVASAVSIIVYVPYIKDIFLGKTKPHIFSWIMWGLLTGISFVAQIKEGAGFGSLTAGIASVLTLVVIILSIKRGEKNITKIDWFCLSGALIGILLWIITKNPLYSIILISIIDTIAFIPTVRKSLKKPYEETLSVYIAYTFIWIIAIISFDQITVTTALYPATLVLTNALFAILLIVKRKS